LLYPHQKKVAKSNARFKVTRGGRRGGKTILKTETMLFKAVSKLIALARKFPNRSVIFIAPTQKQARTIVWETFKQRLGDVGDFNESRLEIKIPTEDGGYATIFIGGWENRENYRGMPNVIHLEFDEVDTMKDFMIGWHEIFRPMLIDTGGSAGFGGTPKKENPNLRRLEKLCKEDPEWESFHFTSWDNPDIPRLELKKAKEEMDADTYNQEIMAEYIDNAGALFHYDALVDLFTNTVEKSNEKYLTVDIADDGSDKTIFAFWNGLEAHHFDIYSSLRTDGIISQIRESASKEKIPYSQIAVDAIGVGAGVASSPLLDGITGFKSSYQAFKTDMNIVRLPNVSYTNDIPLVSEYKNLRSQCVFTLAGLTNEHKVAIKTEDARIKSHIIEELSTYQDASKGDGKRMATQKEDIKALIGRSPDITDTILMRMYFVLKEKISPYQSEERARSNELLQLRMRRTEDRQTMNSTE
ncbi:hypothetical protein LCGC14_2191230, partial [marine sediment metagenome]